MTRPESLLLLWKHSIRYMNVNIQFECPSYGNSAFERVNMKPALFAKERFMSIKQTVWSGDQYSCVPWLKI
jgi:hypothetical protein